LEGGGRGLSGDTVREKLWKTRKNLKG
jgi:hypothetical protein